MFGLDSIGWIQFLIGNFVICLVADMTTVAVAYWKKRRTLRLTSDQARKRKLTSGDALSGASNG